MTTATAHDWNAGYQHFVEGGDAFGCARKSDEWNAGYAAARAEQELEIEQAERDCLADYDNGPAHARRR
jgi:hypothetical protein